jgi:hypothetical protein
LKKPLVCSKANQSLPQINYKKKRKIGEKKEK